MDMEQKLFEKIEKIREKINAGKSSIVLVNPPKFQASDGTIYGETTPLGLKILQQIGINNRFAVTVLNLAREKNPFEKFEETLKKLEPCIVGITSTSPSHKNALRLAELAKEGDRLILMGGVHERVGWKTTLKNSKADFVFVGDSDESFDLFLKNLNKGNLQELKCIEGLAYKENKGIVFTGMAKPKAEKLILPDPYLLEIEHFEPFENLPLARMISARGCSFSCSFCSIEKIMNFENIQRTVDYLEKLYDQGFRAVFFEDATFTINRKRVLEICLKIIEQLHSKGKRLKLGCQTRADCVDFEVLQKMRLAGFHYLYFGIETLSEQALLDVSKGLSVQRALDGLRIARELDYWIAVSLIYGIPNAEKDFMETVQKLSDNGIHEFFIEVIKLYPDARGIPENEREKLCEIYDQGFSVYTGNEEDTGAYTTVDPVQIIQGYAQTLKFLKTGYQQLQGMHFVKNTSTTDSIQILTETVYAKI